MMLVSNIKVEGPVQVQTEPDIAFGFSRDSTFI